MIYETNSAEETRAIGCMLAKKAMPGDVFTLVGGLGVGKTVLTKGFAQGLGIREHVSSPTFTIIQEYEGGRLPFYHFDVYRIADPDELQMIGFDDYIFGQGVCLIEWGNLIEEALPDRRTDIRIVKDLSKGLDYRSIQVEEVGK